jgi:hypothetical protein
MPEISVHNLEAPEEAPKSDVDSMLEMADHRANLAAEDAGIVASEPEPERAEPQPDVEAFTTLQREMLLDDALSESVSITDVPPEVLRGDEDSMRAYLEGKEREYQAVEDAAAVEDWIVDQEGEIELAREQLLEEVKPQLIEGTPLQQRNILTELSKKSPELVQMALDEVSEVDPDVASRWLLANPPSTWASPPSPVEMAQLELQQLRHQEALEHAKAIPNAVQETLAQFGTSQHAQEVLALTRKMLIEGDTPMPRSPEEAREQVLMTGRAADKLLKAAKAEDDSTFAGQFNVINERVHLQDYADGLTDVAPGDVSPADRLAWTQNELLAIAAQGIPEQVTREQYDVGKVTRRPDGTIMVERDPLTDELDQYLNNRHTPDPDGDAALQRAKARQRQLAGERLRRGRIS